MKVVKPLTATRRIGEAWDTAQISFDCSQNGPPGSGGAGTKLGLFDRVTLMVRFESDRQKLFRAKQPKLVPVPEQTLLKTSIDPLMTTSPGDWPRPATLV